MSREKKIRRLNRTIVKITMLGYSTVLVILFLLDCYMIQAHQEKLKAAKWELLNDYTEQVKNSIDKVDQLMYDIYANDKNFQALQKEQSSAKEYSTVYDLREKLHTRLIIRITSAASIFSMETVKSAGMGHRISIRILFIHRK